MIVPALIFAGCFAVGLMAATRWLPDLAPGRVGGMAFFAVCGLIAAACGEVGLGIYSIVRDIETLSHGFEDRVFASDMQGMLLYTGVLVGLAGGIYLLAPPGDEEPGEPLEEAQIAGAGVG